jgi:hypothetical protein
MTFYQDLQQTLAGVIDQSSRRRFLHDFGSRLLHFLRHPSFPIPMTMPRAESPAVKCSQRVASLAAPELPLVAGIFIFGMLLVAVILVVLPIMALASLILELEDGVSVEFL